MRKEIPIPANHCIVGYEEIKIFNNNNFFDSSTSTTYKPIYKRIIPIGSIVTTETTPYLLVSDTEGINAMNKKESIKDYKIADETQISEFKELLSSNGYSLDDGFITKKIIKRYRPCYSVEKGFIPKEVSELNESYKTFQKWNEIFDSKEECANWCNHINKTLNRGYPEIND